MKSESDAGATAGEFRLVRGPRHETQVKLEMMRMMRADGLSWAKVADVLGCTVQAAHSLGKRWGVR